MLHGHGHAHGRETIIRSVLSPPPILERCCNGHAGYSGRGEMPLSDYDRGITRWIIWQAGKMNVGPYSAG